MMSPYDQQVYDAGFKYIPRSEFLLNPFQIPQGGGATAPTQPGLPSINIGGGGGGFNPYNTDMSTIRQDYNKFPSRQAGEIYSRTFNPQSFDPSGVVAEAQRKYNEFQNAPYRMPIDTPVGQRQAKYEKDLNEIIMSNRERYGAQGQYDSPYDPIYSSETEAQKFMDNYPEYYGVPSGVPETGIKGLIDKGINFIPGIGMIKRGAEFLKGMMPINERAIMENEARGAGIFTDDIGRIVTDDYNTAGGIMAGYNLNKIDAGTFDKRRGTIENTLGNKYGLTAGQIEAARNNPNYTGPGADLINRLGLLDEAEEDILGARKKTKIITKRRKDKKIQEKEKREEEARNRREAKAARENQFKQEQERQRQADQARVERAYREETGGQAGSYATGESGIQRDSSGAEVGYNDPFDPGGGEKDGGFIDGTNRRIDFMMGGLADLVDIYD
jgi:hypothetical protein